jgi:hypothetical protein
MTDVRKTLTEAGYIAIGLGVMGFQQAQVRRRELQERVGSTASCLGDRARDAREQLAGVANDATQRVEPIRDRINGHLGELPDRVNKAVEPVYTRAVEPVYTRVRVIITRAA